MFNLNQRKYMKLILLPLFWLACTTAHLQNITLAAPDVQKQEVVQLTDEIIPLNMFIQFN